MANDEKGVNAGAIIISFLAGAAIGTGLALLLAPRSGRETREKVKEAAADAVDAIREYAELAQERLKEAYEEVQNSIRESAASAGRESMGKERYKRG